jgi:hypothetical protein
MNGQRIDLAPGVAVTIVPATSVLVSLAASTHSGGPCSSSLPGSRDHSLQPVAGAALTRQHAGLLHRAAMPRYTRPSK